MIGSVGEATAAFDEVGQIRVHGELWEAHSKGPVDRGQQVKVYDMQGLTLLVMPSLAEGFGLAAAEASACGVPVIASDTSSLPEIVQHLVTGLLVPPGDPVTLAEAVTTLLDDPELGRSLGRAGRQRIITQFSRDRTLRRLLELTGGPALPRKEGLGP